MNLQDKTSREQVLKNVRNALLIRTEMTFPDVDYEKNIYVKKQEELDVLFANELIKNGGKFNYCANTQELVQFLKFLLDTNQYSHFFTKSNKIKNLCTSNNLPVKDDSASLFTSKVSIGGCESVIARLGSVLVSSRQQSGRKLNFFPETHIVLVFPSQIVFTLKQGLKLLSEKYKSKYPSMLGLISGPSRTFEIERNLVIGSHGPKELIVIMIEEPI